MFINGSPLGEDPARRAGSQRSAPDTCFTLDLRKPVVRSQLGHVRILFDHGMPFSLAHGGMQVQIEQTKVALEQRGVEVDYLRWWDDQQRGDLVHYFEAPPAAYQSVARRKNIPLVTTVFFSETCNRSRKRLLAQAAVTRFLLALPFGHTIKNQLPWVSYRRSDCIIVGLQAEKRVLQMVYGIPEDRIRLLPIGCESDFLNARPSPRTGGFLVCVGTLCAQKRTVELAEMAIAANVPMLFIGKPYSDDDPAWLRFQRLAASSDLIRHKGYLRDRQELVASLQQARGSVLFSTFENWSIAADEATACGLPLLLTDLPWARERFGASARYFDARRPQENARILRRFFEDAPELPPAPRPVSWNRVAELLCGIYQDVLTRGGR